MSNQEEFTFKIENVVATVTVDLTEKINLKTIAMKFDDVEYNPERFPGLIMRIDKPKATILVFRTWKDGCHWFKRSRRSPGSRR